MSRRRALLDHLLSPGRRPQPPQGSADRQPPHLPEAPPPLRRRLHRLRHEAHPHRRMEDLVQRIHRLSGPRFSCQCSLLSWLRNGQILMESLNNKKGRQHTSLLFKKYLISHLRSKKSPTRLCLLAEEEKGEDPISSIFFIETSQPIHHPNVTSTSIDQSKEKRSRRRSTTSTTTTMFFLNLFFTLSMIVM